MKERLEYRMYGLVPYNISPIQQGIQFGHAVVEYGLDYGQGHADDPYLQWARNDKTFIILNGGTTNKSRMALDNYGTLNKALDELKKDGIEVATFYEPDLGDQLTAVVFLVDERVWDKEKYPEYNPHHTDMEPWDYYDLVFGEDAKHILEMRDFLSLYKLA